MRTSTPGEAPANATPRDGQGGSPPANAARVERTLRRIFRAGGFHAFPTNPLDRDTLLAVVACTLDRQRPYAEQEINEALVAWLASVRGTPDHVTLRRRMIDCGFLKRTPNGSRYYLNYGRVVDTLGAGPADVDAGGIVAGILREREVRKRTHLARSETTSAGG